MDAASKPTSGSFVSLVLFVSRLLQVLSVVDPDVLVIKVKVPVTRDKRILAENRQRTAREPIIDVF